jgi:predicted house-cleaning noncanonical NTP pyrophosphatase (MazG superfamily)
LKAICSFESIVNPATRPERAARIEVMSEPEYRQALLEKLVEEAQEAAQAGGDDLISELADLYEVIDAILAAWDISGEQVLEMQQGRRQQRGEFTRRLKLLWTE